MNKNYYRKALTKEKDRRYDERHNHYKDIRSEQEKALAIKEKESEKSLTLARDIQTYKDTQHNNILAQLKDERATYATKAEIEPLVKYITSQQGRDSGVRDWWAWIIAGISVLVAMYSALR